MHIAFFGLGNMGFPIAANLLKHGHTVTTAVHRNPDSALRFQALGGMVAPSPAQAVEGAELIFTIVPEDTTLLELLLSPAMAEAIAPGSVIVDMTSASPGAIQTVAGFYEPRGVAVLDAPVSGGVAGAKAGTMTMLCAGSKDVLERVTPVLEHISGKRCCIGPRPGQGKIVKSLNNLLNAVNKAAVGEAWQMAEAHGIDPDAFSEAISASSGGSYAFRTTFPRIQKGDYAPAFTVALMRKDVGLALALAEGKHLPLSETTLQYYERAREFDGEDSSAVTKVRFPAHEEE